MTVVRERGPQLAPTQGPGYHDYLPHDAVHFLVEAEAGLAGGVFGRVAAGENQMFWPSDPSLLRRTARREKKRSRSRSSAEHADMGRSEELAGLCQVMWEMKEGLRASAPEWFSRVPSGAAESPVMRRIMTRLDEFASQWRPLRAGGSVTLDWPHAVVKRSKGVLRRDIRA
jgi:hypothetical protein